MDTFRSAGALDITPGVPLMHASTRLGPVRHGVTFREHQPGPIWLRVVGIVASLSAVTGLVFGTPTVLREWGTPTSWSLLVGMIALIVVGGAGFTTLIWDTIDIAVEDGILVAWLRPLRVLRVPLNEVAEVNETMVSPRDAAGMGLRWTPSGTYLLWRAESGVELQTRRGRVFHIQTDRPTELRAILDPSQASP